MIRHLVSELGKGSQATRQTRVRRRRRLCVLEGLEERVLLSGNPTVYTVTDTSDNVTDTGSLRYAISQANANTNTAGSEITFSSLFNMPQTISLGSTLALTETAGPEMIEGPGASNLTISGNNKVGVFNLAEGVTATLSGVTISGGMNNQAGGAIDNDGTLTVTNSTFINNTSGADGGAVANDGTLAVTDCTIEKNTAPFSGGIDNDGMLTVTGSTIENNTATEFGGGIDNHDGGMATLTNATVANNSAVISGGGVFNEGDSMLAVANSTLSDNRAASGGGIFLEGDGGDPANPMTVTDSTFSGNESTGTASNGGGGALYNAGGTASFSGSTLAGNTAIHGGGGIFVGSGSLTILDSTLSGNSVTGSFSQGGGIDENSGTVTLTNSTIAGNSAQNVGAGIQQQSGRLTAVNCTIAYNTEPSNGDGFGGGVNMTNGTATLYNTIIALNTDGTGPGAPADNIYSDGEGTVSDASAHNLLGTGGNSGVTNGSNGNLVGVANPGLGMLANNGGPTDTIALLAGSPAIMAGSVSLAVDPQGSPLATDQRGAGFPRVVNGTVDIGAFETQATIPNPAPSLTTILPSEAAVGSDLPVTGSGFISQSVVDWNTTALATTDVSSTELTATIPASDLASTGSFSITVTNPTPGGGTSTAATFQVVAVPTSVYVNAAYASDPPGTTVTWTDGSTHTVSYDAFGTVQAGVTAVASGGTVDIATGTYSEQVTITRSLTLAGAGVDATYIQVPTSVTTGAGISIAGGAAVDVTMSGLSVLKSGAVSATGILDNGCALSVNKIGVAGFTSGVAVENEGTATITDNSIIDNMTGIVVGSSSSDNSFLFANNNNLAGDNVGVQNNQASGYLTATLNYWGSTSGPTTSANPGGTGVASVGGVWFSPWLGDANLEPYDYLVFSTTAADRYVVLPISGNTFLSVTNSNSSPGGIPSGLSLGTIPGGSTLGFSGNGGSVIIDGESGSIADDFYVKDTTVQFQAADGLHGTTITFNGTAITRDVDAEGTNNTFNIMGAGVSGPSGDLVGDSGTNEFTFNTGGNVLGNIKGGGKSTLNYQPDSTAVMVFLENGTNGTATGVGGSVSGITAVIGSNLGGPVNDELPPVIVGTFDWLNAGSVPGVALTGGLGENILTGTEPGDSVVESIASSYTFGTTARGAFLTDTGLSFIDWLGGIKVANLTGTSAISNSFNVSDWTGTGSLFAPSFSTSAVTASKNANFIWTNTSLQTSDGMALTLSGINIVKLTGTGSGDVFAPIGWTHGGTLTGANDTVVATESANMTLTNLLLTSGTMSLGLSGIKTADLSAALNAGQPSAIVDASAFSGVTNMSAFGGGNAILFSGSGGHSTMAADGAGNDILIGDSPNMTLVDTGSGHNILIGAGAGGDSLSGDGKDILVSGRTKYDSDTSAHIAALDAILAEWTSNASYANRIKAIKAGVGNNHADAFNSQTIQADTKSNTLADRASLPVSSDWFLVSNKDHVTKKNNETKTMV